MGRLPIICGIKMESRWHGESCLALRAYTTNLTPSPTLSQWYSLGYVCTDDHAHFHTPITFLLHCCHVHTSINDASLLLHAHVSWKQAGCKAKNRIWRGRAWARMQRSCPPIRCPQQPVPQLQGPQWMTCVSLLPPFGLIRMRAIPS